MTKQLDLIQREPRRMVQPTKDALRNRLRIAEERIAALQAARQHDHDTARKVPRILRQLFGA